MKQIVSRHRGMTLIEVMIALMVFAIGVLGVLNALTRSI
jgi:prepilin-type N-terminal cleavage/methylation domain-containing protein